jgi:hypothetical protein
VNSLVRQAAAGVRVFPLDGASAARVEFLAADRSVCAKALAIIRYNYLTVEYVHRLGKG